MVLIWGEGAAGRRACAGLEPLERSLREVHATRRGELPVLAVIETGRHCVILGLGRDEVPLSIQEVRGPDAPAREWISVGDPRRTGSVDFFYLGGDVSEMEERQLVPFESALRAALDFVRTGMVPANVKWEDHSF